MLLMATAHAAEGSSRGAAVWYWKAAALESLNLHAWTSLAAYFAPDPGTHSVLRQECMNRVTKIKASIARHAAHNVAEREPGASGHLNATSDELALAIDCFSASGGQIDGELAALVKAALRGATQDCSAEDLDPNQL
jgi:hypothetical protein